MQYFDKYVGVEASLRELAEKVGNGEKVLRARSTS
jgi:hypothetical protein